MRARRGVLLGLSLALGCARAERDARPDVHAPSALSRARAEGPEARTTGPAADAPDRAPDLATAVPDPPSELVLHKVERTLMATPWAVTIVGGDAERARAAGERALDEVARLEALLSEWQPDSEISRVNRAAGGAPVKVGPELLACVRASLEIARWSDGAFDISWASLRGLWDFSARSAHVPPSPARVRERLPLWNYRNIVIDEAAGTLLLRQPGVQIGLGGVAKGYALDRAGAVLQEAGFTNYVLFAGGQVLVHGRRGDRPWRIGIQHPRAAGQFAYVELTEGSVATSGDYEHAYRHGGRTYHHILDPKTGFPSRRSAAVTLVAPTALWADAVDTALFVMGPKAALAAIDHAPGGPHAAAIIDPTLHLHVTDRLREKLTMLAPLDAHGRLPR